MEEERWIAIPTLRTINEVQIYCWEGFEVRESRKGKGVFAKKFHSAVQLMQSIQPGDELLLNYGVDDQHREICGYNIYGRQLQRTDYRTAYAAWKNNMFKSLIKRAENIVRKRKHIDMMNQARKEKKRVASLC